MVSGKLTDSAAVPTSSSSLHSVPLISVWFWFMYFFWMLRGAVRHLYAPRFAACYFNGISEITLLLMTVTF